MKILYCTMLLAMAIPASAQDFSSSGYGTASPAASGNPAPNAAASSSGTTSAAGSPASAGSAGTNPAAVQRANPAQQSAVPDAGAGNLPSAGTNSGPVQDMTEGVSGRRNAGGYSLIGGNVYGAEDAAAPSNGAPAVTAGESSSGASPPAAAPRTTERSGSSDTQSVNRMTSGASGAAQSQSAAATATQFSDATTPGWSQMSAAERDAYSNAMRQMSNVDQCRNYHRARMAELRSKAQQSGAQVVQQTVDPCAGMSSSGTP